MGDWKKPMKPKIEAVKFTQSEIESFIKPKDESNSNSGSRR